MSRIVDAFNDDHQALCVMSHYDKDKEEGERISLKFKKPLFLPEIVSLFTEIKQCRESYMALNAKNRRKDDGKMLKHAAHLIRLLESGLELSQTGKLNVFRPDAAYLLEIRQGKYSMEEIIDKATDLFVKLDESSLTTVLPDFAHTTMIDSVYQILMENRYKSVYFKTQ